MSYIIKSIESNKKSDITINFKNGKYITFTFYEIIMHTEIEHIVDPIDTIVCEKNKMQSLIGKPLTNIEIKQYTTHSDFIIYSNNVTSVIQIINTCDHDFKIVQTYKSTIDKQLITERNNTYWFIEE